MSSRYLTEDDRAFLQILPDGKTRNTIAIDLGARTRAMPQPGLA